MVARNISTICSKYTFVTTMAQEPNVFYLVLGHVIVMGHFVNQKYNIQKHQQSNTEYTESHQILYLECL